MPFKTSVGRLIRTVIPPRTYGALRYRLTPGRGRGWGGPFNGQAKRCLLFAALVEKLQPEAIVETGTFLGTTTEWIAAFQLPVFTVESDVSSFGFSSQRLKSVPNIRTLLGDSRKALREILDIYLSEKRMNCIIFYLDTHWNDDLPLGEEIAYIVNNAPKAVVIIDDFQVYDDSGYGFDAYGPGKTLNLRYVKENFNNISLHLYYQSTPSSEETGARRGCVVICASDSVSKQLSELELLREISLEQETSA